MSLEHLWAGWRMAYVTAADDDPAGSADPADTADQAEGVGPRERCVLCRVLAADGPDDETFILWRGATCVAVLNAYPYTSGHLMVMPRRHVGELEELEPAEAAELWRAVTHGVTAVKAAYRPEGLNVGINLGRAAGAGVPGHLHVHVLPRWSGDTNFTTAVAGLRVLPESLPVTWERLRAVWPAEGGPS